MDQDIIYVRLGLDNDWHILPAKIIRKWNDNSVQAVYFEFMSKEPLVDDFIKSNDGDYWVFKSNAIGRPYAISQKFLRASNDLKQFIKAQEYKNSLR
jgi:hypothetical protein